MAATISELCAQAPYCSSYIYSQAHRIAAEWLVEHQPLAANPVISGIRWGSVEDMNLVFALREAYVAGMIMGSCLQKDEHEGKEPRI